MSEIDREIKIVCVRESYRERLIYIVKIEERVKQYTKVFREYFNTRNPSFF